MRYQAKINDSPTRIAREYGVPFEALINANPHKPTKVVDGRITWASLVPFEEIIVPVGGMVGDSASDALTTLSTVDPCRVENASLVCAAQRALGFTPGAGVDGKWGANDASAAQARGFNVPACSPRPSWWTPKGQSNCPTAAPAPAPAAGSSLSSAANAAFAALKSDPNYCASVKRVGTPVNTAIHNFKAAWNRARPDNPVPINTGNYEPIVQIALALALDTPQENVPPGCGAAPTVTPAPAPAPAPSSGLVSAASAAISALKSDPNYCVSVRRAGTPVNRAVHNFKSAWNSARPDNPVPINTGNYEPIVQIALALALDTPQENVPTGCGAASSTADAAAKAAAAAAAKAAQDAAAKAAAAATQAQADQAAAAAKAAAQAAADATAAAAKAAAEATTKAQADAAAAAAKAAADATAAAAKAAADAAAKGGTTPGGQTVLAPEEKKLSTGAIAAGVIGAIALVGIVAVAATGKPGRAGARGRRGARGPAHRKSKPSHRRKKR